MPLSKNVDSYPANFADIARNVKGLEKPFTFTCDSSAKATRMRQQFYGFAGALEHRGKDITRALPLREEDQMLSSAIRQIEIRKEGSTLFFVSRLDTDAYRLGEALLAHVSPRAKVMEEQFGRVEKIVDDRDHAAEALAALGYTSTPQPPVLETVPDSEPQPTPPIADKIESGYDALMKRTSNEDPDGK